MVAVAVVGAGFSGLLTAIHLLRLNPRVQVRLIEKAAQFAAGRAYAAASQAHLLNVRAANMSAFPDQPDHFCRWLARDHAPQEGDAFVSRRTYGAYLRSLLRDAIGSEDHAGRLLLEQDEAVALAPRGEGFRISLAMGRTLDVDAAVLAVGLGPPRAPPGAGRQVIASPRYVGDPWTLDAASLPAGEILLVGAGLTMVDVAITLGSRERRLTALSRRGLLPHRHASTAPAQIPDGELRTPGQALRALRVLAREAGWRSAVDGVRPLTPAIWRSWSLAERRRFLRHLQPWWDIHRHRMAPEVADRIGELITAGRLQIQAGRLVEIAPEPDGALRVTLIPRGATVAHARRFEAVVNCTGLSGNIAGSPLLADLARQGLLRPDPLRLGADVDAAFRLVDQGGLPQAGLYAVGPLTRAARWETVAAPDLRSQTAEVAATLLSDLTARQAA